MAKKNISASRMNWYLVALSVFLIGIIIGMLVQGADVVQRDENAVQMNGKTYIPVGELTGEFKTTISDENDFAVFEGKTWISIAGEPIEVLVVTDTDCGQVCDPTQSIATLKQVLTPALLVRNVEINSQEGEMLRERFDLNTLPSFILGSGIERLKKGDQSIMEQLQPFVTKKEDMYLLNSSAVGFPVGRYVDIPEIDTEGEPTLGKGAVRVVEFTDFQCPYCKRLYDQNKDLIEDLIQQGTVQYIVKDFPLQFHRESASAHVVANCVQRLGGNEAYWTAKNRFFDLQEQWSGKGVEGVRAIADDLVQELGLDESEWSACLDDPQVKTEIADDIAEAQKLGINGTPTLFIGHQRMPGAIGPEMFRKAVENETTR